jgi:hypothetical protein
MVSSSEQLTGFIESLLYKFNIRLNDTRQSDRVMFADDALALLSATSHQYTSGSGKHGTTH